MTIDSEGQNVNGILSVCSDATAYHLSQAIECLHGKPGRWEEIEIDYLPILTRLEDMIENKAERRKALFDFLRLCVPDGAVRTAIIHKIARAGRRPEDDSRVNNNSGTKEPWNSGTPESNGEDFGMENLANVAPKRIDWIVEGVLARRKLTLISGKGGSGKSQVAIAYIASITTGKPLPDGTLPRVTGSVALMAAEDDRDDTIVPRLMAAGADMSKVYRLTPRETVTNEKGEKSLSPRCIADTDYWARMLDKHPDVVLIVADTLPSYMGRLDDNRNVEVKQALEPFINDVLAARGVACLGIVHVGKGKKDKAVDLILGSVAYANTARIVWMVVDDPHRPGGFVFAWTKGNNTPRQKARPFLIQSVEVEFNGELFPTSKVLWAEQPVDKSADEILASAADSEKKKRGPAPEKKQSAKNFLMEYLTTHGPTAYKVMVKAWTDSGQKRGTLDNAAEELISSKHLKTNGLANGNVFEIVSVPPPDPEPPHQEPDEYWDKRFRKDPFDEQDWWKDGPPPEE
jgi:putative DNA primase/helicase